jgi:uncharacterized protein (DUF983 family)
MQKVQHRAVRRFLEPDCRGTVAVMTDNSSSGTPQFSTAEYADRSAATTCKSCGQKISGAFYRVNGAPTCADCTRRLQQQMPQDSHAAFVRGVLFGVGAAVVGCVIYVVFALTTGLVIGYVSLAVGYLVGKAIVMGSRGVGGRRYQVAAVLLTYMAVSLAAVPIALSAHMKHKSAQQHTQVSDPAATPAASASATVPATAPAPKMSFGRAIGVLALLGLASPFLDLANPMHGIIGLIILLVGIRIAWQLTAAKPLQISGPLDQVAPAASG